MFFSLISFHQRQHFSLPSFAGRHGRLTEGLKRCLDAISYFIHLSQLIFLTAIKSKPKKILPRFLQSSFNEILFRRLGLIFEIENIKH